MNTKVKSSSMARGRAKSQQIHSYAELQERLHYDLLAQHPEWIERDGNCPKCDEYDRRFAELVSIFQSVSRAA